jgi:hypothetical protein
VALVNGHSGMRQQKTGTESCEGRGAEGSDARQKHRRWDERPFLPRSAV